MNEQPGYIRLPETGGLHDEDAPEPWALFTLGAICGFLLASVVCWVLL